MSAKDLQILVVVDLYPGVSIDDVKAQLPAERDDRKVLRLSEQGVPPILLPPDTTPVDWQAIGAGVERLAAQIHEIQATHPDHAVVYVAGKGPLAVFVHLGYKLTKSIRRVVVLNPPPGGGPWESFVMESAAEGAADLLDDVRGLPPEPVPSDGRLAIAFDTAGRSTDRTVFSGFLKEEGEPVAGVIQLRSSEKLHVTPGNVGVLARQVAQFLSMAPARYPDRSGLAVFVAGPTQLAFAIGRAMSPNVLGNSLWLTEYRHPKYGLVYALPFAAESSPAIPSDAESVLVRRNVHDEMMGGIEELKKELKPAHLPTGLLPEDDRAKFMTCLAELRPSRKTNEEEPFEMRVVEGRYTLANGGILQALALSTAEQQRAFAKLLFLHELIHDWQTLRSTNYTSIGRACFVLEQVDYAADVFALQTLVNLEIDHGGTRAREGVSKLLRDWIEHILHGIQCFDLMEQGSKMTRLPERRLRRYLLWHLQLARAATVTDASHVAEMLRQPLTVELAPLAGHTDAQRHDKVVTRALPDTELFIGIGGYLVRAPKRPGFEPGTLVEAVRSFAQPPIQKVMVAVVDEHRSRLAPWRA